MVPWLLRKWPKTRLLYYISCIYIKTQPLKPYRILKNLIYNGDIKMAQNGCDRDGPRDKIFIPIQNGPFMSPSEMGLFQISPSIWDHMKLWYSQTSKWPISKIINGPFWNPCAYLATEPLLQSFLVNLKLNLIIKFEISRQKISFTSFILSDLMSPCIVKGREITKVIFCADIPCPLFWED